MYEGGQHTQVNNSPKGTGLGQGTEEKSQTLTKNKDFDSYHSLTDCFLLHRYFDIYSELCTQFHIEEGSEEDGKN